MYTNTLYNSHFYKNQIYFVLLNIITYVPRPQSTTRTIQSSQFGVIMLKKKNGEEEEEE